jgi:hypothetical protein
MARKGRDEKSGKEPALKVVGGEPAQPAPAPPPQPEVIFHDARSGRDRREEAGKVEDSRRQSSERRSRKLKGAWWLERDYVESHHFVQKSASSRRRREDKPSDD